MLKNTGLIVFILLSVSCAVVPVKKPHSIRDNECGISSHEWDLKMIQAGQYSAHCNSAECVVSIGLVAAAVTSVTAIVSGSIVVVGNVIHWIEQQGSCDSEKLNATIKEINAPLLEQGGKPIKTRQALEKEIKEIK